jgi:hypothetical protein
VRQGLPRSLSSLLEDPRLKDLMSRPGHVAYDQKKEIIFVDPFPDHSLDAR